MKKRLLSILLAAILVVAILPASAFAANDSKNVDLKITVRDFKADGKLFENEMGFLIDAPNLVQKTLGADKKPVYNLANWKELYGEDVTQKDLDALFNDVSGVNMKAEKTLTLRPDEEGYWMIDSSLDEFGNDSDGFFPIDNELFGNFIGVEDGETIDYEHNFHFSVEIHTNFKYVEGGMFEFDGDDDVWVFFNNQRVIDLGGVHGSEYERIDLSEIASQLGIKIGDIVDFDMFYMERHTTGSNLMIRTNFDFLNLQASPWAQSYMEQADALGLIPDCLIGQDLTKQITRKEFAAVAVKIYESLSGEAATPIAVNPFTDCNDTEVLKAYNIGITNGTATDKFSPDVILSREELATMLTRIYKKVALEGWTLATDGNFNARFKTMFTMPAAFADDASISAWAKDSVYFMKAQGIIDGVGNNMFAPKHGTSANEAASYGLATREQALKIAIGMVQNLK